MRAMILAAGRGERMGFLTAGIPKPLISLNQKFLIEHSIEALASINVTDIVINLCYYAEQIKCALGDGSRYGVKFHYSEEEYVLETGGGIIQALPLLGDEPFLVLSSDLITHYQLKNLPTHPAKLAHIVLVDNPDFYPGGDFSLQEQRVGPKAEKNLTFGNIGVYHPKLFAGYKPGVLRLGEILRDAVEKDQVTGEYYDGLWYNVTRPEHILNVELDTRLAPHF